jgi:hypothetical protein
MLHTSKHTRDLHNRHSRQDGSKCLLAGCEQCCNDDIQKKHFGPK